MIARDDKYGMDRMPHTEEDNEFVNAVVHALLDVTRYNDATMLQLFGAIEFAKQRIREFLDEMTVD